MTLLRRLSGCACAAAGGALLAGLTLTGCTTTDVPQFVDAAGEAAAITTNRVERFSVGDLVIVNYSGLSGSTEQMPVHEERIKEDGTITPSSLIGPVQAAGKTPGELQRDLQEQYNRYYNNLTVTVQTKERVYWVGGEVRKPDRYVYTGETTVTKAIQAAGDFTDYANKKKVTLTHASGKTVRVDCVKALRDPTFDPPVFPGDQIHVSRRIW